MLLMVESGEDFWKRWPSSEAVKGGQIWTKRERGENFGGGNSLYKDTESGEVGALCGNRRQGSVFVLVWFGLGFCLFGWFLVCVHVLFFAFWFCFAFRGCVRERDGKSQADFKRSERVPSGAGRSTGPHVGSLGSGPASEAGSPGVILAAASSATIV